MKLYNSTVLPFNITVQTPENVEDIGICYSNWLKDKKMKTTSRSIAATKKTKIPKISNPFQNKSTALLSETPSSLGIPINLLSDYINKRETSRMTLFASPMIQENILNPNEPYSSHILVGALINLPSMKSLTEMAKDGTGTKVLEIPFRLHSKNKATVSPLNSSRDVLMTAQVCIKVSLIKKIHPFVEVFIQPRAVLRNTLAINLILRTPMPHTYSIHNGIVSECKTNAYDGAENHMLYQGDSLEVFTAGPAVNFSVSFADIPVSGTKWGWLDFGIPLGIKREIDEPIQCIIPTEKSEIIREEIDFIISKSIDIFETYNIDTDESTAANDTSLYLEEQIQYTYFTSPNFAFDKTKDLFFEPAKKSNAANSSTPNFLTSDGDAYITLLPDATKSLILSQSFDGEKKRRSLPFTVEDISICLGGIESSRISWEDKTRSGYYLYRKFAEFNRSEIYIIPEFSTYYYSM